jgi:hypothetical protein
LSGWVEIYRSPVGSPQSGAEGLIACLRAVFATFGVPEMLSSDGGPEFTASKTESFLSRWGVHHRVSSASFPQSNGRAEVAVKKAKRTLMDNVGPSGSVNNDSLLRALLQLRNTPDPDCNVSPAEVVFGRQIRDAFSFINRREKFVNPSIRPLWREAWTAKEGAMRTRLTRSQEALSAHTRDLPSLPAGSRVLVQNQRGSHPTKWDKSGIVVEVSPHDQYLVRIDGSGRLTRRNRRFLRAFTPPSSTIDRRLGHLDDNRPSALSGPSTFDPTSPPAMDIPQAPSRAPSMPEPCAPPSSNPPPAPAKSPVDPPSFDLPDSPNIDQRPMPDPPAMQPIETPITTPAPSVSPTATAARERPVRQHRSPAVYVPETGKWVRP